MPQVGCQHARSNGEKHCIRDGDFEELQGSVEKNDTEHLNFAASLAKIDSKFDRVIEAIGEPPDVVMDKPGTGLNGKVSMLLNKMLESGMSRRQSLDWEEGEITGMMDRTTLVARAKSAEMEAKTGADSEAELQRKYKLAMVGVVIGGIVSIIGAVAAIFQAMQ
jgi:hypothetical protein